MVKKYARWASRLQLPVLLTGALLVAFITCFVQPMAAQESRATIRGVVSDPTQAVVPGAKVTLHNTATNVDRVKDADSSGFYVFDQVTSGAYSLSVEASGFQKFVQENIVVQATGDITVNAVLALGATTQTVEVTAAVGQVEFNTSNMSVTVQQSYLRDLPVLARNPFTLAMLDAGVINDYWDVSHRLPFYMWSDGGLDIGGPTGGKNEQIIDGVRTDIAARGTYNATMDAVQEVVVQQNIPDAEHGFSAGGAVNITTKSGSNDFHGTAYIMTRQPKWNALANRVDRSSEIVKQNIWGFTVGNPVLKNKLFNFFGWEHWYATQPSNVNETMPTALERAGDFRQSVTADGVTQRAIYDPNTSVYDPVHNTLVRQQVSCNGALNVICPGAMDPTGKMLMGYLWYPKNTPDNPDGLNNFKLTYPWWTKYHNFSDRVDYNLSDKWRMYARYSAFRTRLDNVNWSAGYMNGGAPSIGTPSDNGGIMDATSSMIDALYMPSPKTTLDIRLGVNYEEDDYNSTWSKVPLSVWAGLWPNTNFYQSINNTVQGIYFPDLSWSGIGYSRTGVSGWWYDHLRDYEPSITVTHEIGKHHMKIGWWHRYAFSQNFENQGSGGWNFYSQDTSATCCGMTYNAPDSGDPYASSLIGVVNSGNATILPLIDQVHYQMDGVFIQDDFRLNPRTTLNLGLRWERETGPGDVNHWLIRTLDTRQAIPGMQGFKLWTPGVMSVVNNLAASTPAAVNIPFLQQPIFNGMVERTSPTDSRSWDAPFFTFLPRMGVAYRLNEKTALRFGWSRFAVSQVSNRSDESWDYFNGYSQATSTLGPLAGVPRTFIQDPYPTGGSYPNPIIPAVGSALGPYQDLGNGWSYWDSPVYKVPINDRFNFNVQRQLPSQFRLDITEFLMFERNAQDGSMWGGFASQNINMMNPMFAYQYKGLLSTQVPNPFYGAFPTSLASAGVSSVTSSYKGLPIMPGTMGTTATTSLGQLLRPYPQFGDLNVAGWPHQRDHYYGTAISITRPMTHGWTFLGTYNYSLQNHTQYYDDVDTYNQKLTMMDRGIPRHNIRLSGTYQLPFGKGRQFFSSAPTWLDEIIGGWSTSNIFYWVSGDLLNFSGYIYGGLVCNPTENVPKGMWFNANCLTNNPAYTMATGSPWWYEGLRGPHYWDLDTTAVKNFRITESKSLEFRLEMYNMPNVFIPSDPNICGVSQCHNTAGISTSIMRNSNGANYGREIQLSGRLHF